eukprot:10726856-Ditylum_brightwellii.AAC.1
MAVMNGSTDVGAVDDRRRKTPPDNCIALFDHNKMLQNKNVQVENEEKMKRTITFSAVPIWQHLSQS